MSIDYFLSRVLRIFTLLSLGITLLFIYRGLPDPVAVHFGETGRGDGFLPKAEVFYLLAGVITVLNILILLFSTRPRLKCNWGFFLSNSFTSLLMLLFIPLGFINSS
jgi:uncharacterized membrane protein